MSNRFLIPEMSQLSPTQHAALRLLVEGETVAATARQTGVDRKTLHNWLRPDTRFSFCLDALIDSFNQNWAAQVKAATQNSLALLNEIITDEQTPKHLRLRAALSVLNRDRKAGWPRAIHELSRSARDLSPVTEFPGEETAEIEVPQNSPLFEDFAEDETDPPAAIPQNSSLSQKNPAIPRNTKCPCGSGQKYKRCCGKDAPPVLHPGSEAA